jgi:uncharacterized surface protein with fasciclin (FAS1) repeats
MTTSAFRSLQTGLLALTLSLAAPFAAADDDDGYRYKKPPTILDTLVNTDGAQALVAAVLVVDEAGALHFSLADVLGNKRAEVLLFAPSNAAFEKLLGLGPGTLNGLNIQQVKDALPSLLPPGVGVGDVANILLQHVSQPRKANLWTSSEDALLKKGEVKVADGSTYPVGIGATGVQVNYETTIIKADTTARNGVIQYIDTVIVDDAL